MYHVERVEGYLSTEAKNLYIHVTKFSTFIRKYPFFFDVEHSGIKDGGNYVKLREDLAHPRKGIANKKYTVSLNMYDIQENIRNSTQPVPKIENNTSSYSLTRNTRVDSTIRNLFENEKNGRNNNINLIEHRYKTSLKTIIYIYLCKTNNDCVSTLKGHNEIRIPIEYIDINTLNKILPSWLNKHPEYNASNSIIEYASQYTEIFQTKGNYSFIRIRPGYLAPNSLDEYTIDSSPVKATIQSILKHINENKRWMDIISISKMVPPEDQLLIKKKFRSLTRALRSHGTLFEVSTDNLKVRLINQAEKRKLLITTYDVYVFMQKEYNFT